LFISVMAALVVSAKSGRGPEEGVGAGGEIYRVCFGGRLWQAVDRGNGDWGHGISLYQSFNLKGVIAVVDGARFHF
jgi:hypothetical protein